MPDGVTECLRVRHGRECYLAVSNFHATVTEVVFKSEIASLDLLAYVFRRAEARVLCGTRAVGLPPLMVGMRDGAMRDGGMRDGAVGLNARDERAVVHAW